MRRFSVVVLSVLILQAVKGLVTNRNGTQRSVDKLVDKSVNKLFEPTFDSWPFDKVFGFPAARDDPWTRSAYHDLGMYPKLQDQKPAAAQQGLEPYSTYHSPRASKIGPIQQQIKQNQAQRAQLRADMEQLQAKRNQLAYQYRLDDFSHPWIVKTIKRVDQQIKQNQSQRTRLKTEADQLQAQLGQAKEASQVTQASSKGFPVPKLQDGSQVRRHQREAEEAEELKAKFEQAAVEPSEAKLEPATVSSVREVPHVVQDDGASAKPIAPTELPIGTKVLRNGQEAVIVGIDHSVYPKGYIVRMQSDGREVITEADRIQVPQQASAATIKELNPPNDWLRPEFCAQAYLGIIGMSTAMFIGFFLGAKVVIRFCHSPLTAGEKPLLATVE